MAVEHDRESALGFRWRSHLGECFVKIPMIEDATIVLSHGQWLSRVEPAIRRVRYRCHRNLIGEQTTGEYHRATGRTPYESAVTSRLPPSEFIPIVKLKPRSRRRVITSECINTLAVWRKILVTHLTPPIVNECINYIRAQRARLISIIDDVDVGFGNCFV